MSLASTCPDGAILQLDVERDVADITEKLNRDGFVCLENAVNEAWLQRARDNVLSLIDREGAKFFSVIRPGDEQGSPASDLVQDPQVQRLLREATASVCSDGLAEYEPLYNVLRIISGPRGSAGSLNFHYDASVITALVPIFIPESGYQKSGELLVEPNRRPFRKSVLFNIVEKLLWQNRLASAWWARKVQRQPSKYIRQLKPGNFYLFWGYRTYHANLACAPGSLRATMLLHYGNPHGDAPILRAVRGSRRVVENVRRRFS